MIKDAIDFIVFIWPILILIILLIVLGKNIIKLITSLIRNNKVENDEVAKENIDKNTKEVKEVRDDKDDKDDKDAKDKGILIHIPLIFGTIPLKIPSKAVYFVILIISISSIITIVAYRDYSYAYNDTYEFEVFYKVQKIEELINIVKERDSTVNIPQNWNSKKIKYLDSIPFNESPFIEEVVKNENIGEYLHTTGLSVHKTSYYRLFQNYKIDKVEGFLKHEYRPPNSKGIIYTSNYELIPTDNNLIEPTVNDFIKGSYISKLRIGQTVTCNSNIDYSIPIISFTKSRFFPMSRIEFSLFCFEINDEIIPFAYSRYVD